MKWFYNDWDIRTVYSYLYTIPNSYAIKLEVYEYKNNKGLWNVSIKPDYAGGFPAKRFWTTNKSDFSSDIEAKEWCINEFNRLLNEYKKEIILLEEIV